MLRATVVEIYGSKLQMWTRLALALQPTCQVFYGVASMT
jgi:hypothetical protein